MRIGMMADVYKPHISGITNYISLNKQFLEKNGHQVFVFTFSEGDEYHDDEPNVIRSPGLPLLDTGYYISLRYTPHARKLLHTMDVAHVHHPFLSGSLALLYCRQQAVPIIFTNHTRYDLYSRAYLPPMADFLGLAAVKAYLPSFCRSCDLVISPSPGMRDVLVEFGVDVPIDVVPNGVDLEPFKSPVESTRRAELGFDDTDVVLVYVGRLGPEKNLPFLLRAFSGTVQAYKNTRLLLIGDGPERDNLQELVTRSGICDSVRFIGAVEYKDLPVYLAVANAFVTASVTEVHPLTVIEAMAAGLPVLGIRSPGIADTVEDEVSGLLAAEEDLASFTAKMVRLVREHGLRQKMGENARKVSTEFAIERTTALMEDHYKRVIDKAKSRKRGIRVRFSRWVESLRR
jgi:glycosyltransferase involved in cell wall biosynthesis